MKPASTAATAILLFALAATPGCFAGLPAPQDFGASLRMEALLDAGYIWEVNSLFHPLNIPTIEPRPPAGGWMIDRFADFSTEAAAGDGDLRVLLLPGVEVAGPVGPQREFDDPAVTPLLWSRAEFRRNWFADFYFRLTSEPAALDHYSGVPREKRRLGLSSGEIDRAVIGWRGEWIAVEYGRSREIQGPLQGDNLVLAGRAPAWERLAVEFRYKRFTYRWFVGFLETLEVIGGGDMQRYIAGRCLEYRNRRNLVLGLAETSVLAGVNRPPDWSLLNPLALHLESEQNDRTNTTSNRDNAVWSAYLDYLPLPNLRVSGAFALDEVKLDREESSAGAADALAWQGRVAWTPLKRRVTATVFGEYVRVDTHTFQHQFGETNFVTRGAMLGNPIGNDADKAEFGCRILPPQPVILEAALGMLRRGGNSLLDDPYKPYDEYVKQPFPSGTVTGGTYLRFAIDAQPTAGFSLGVQGSVDIHAKKAGGGSEAWVLTLRCLHPLRFNP